jgi:UDPglucose 6-dehydrogenase
MIQNVSIIGLGKLGASMAAGMASRGLNVVGVDVNHHAVDALNEGKAPVQETGLADMIAENKERLRGTMSTEEAVANSDISFVIVPTPSDERGAFTIQYARYAFKALGQALAKKNGYHVIVLTSTVLPGATRHGLLPILEKESGKKCGPDFGLCYNPEFIALGSVIRDFLNPDFYLLGQFDERSGDLLEQVHHRVSQNNAPVKRMSLENAELAKIAVNSFVTMKISFANMLAEFCEKLPGGDVDVVSDALGMDKRIGRKYLTGGFGFGGPCFPRDNVALNFMGGELGVDTRLLKSNDDYNRGLSARFVEKLAP